MSGAQRSAFGPKPWRQQHWDARAAVNFGVGGTGGGMLAAIAAAVALQMVAPLTMIFALALIAIGLTAVWFEIGRPLRALHVYFNPFTSWMTREAFVAAVAFACSLATWLAPTPALTETFAIFAAVAGVGFAYCQGRMLRASRGIPAWREPAIVAFIVATDLAEGVALASLAIDPTMLPNLSLPLLIPAQVPLLIILCVVRLVAWARYRARVHAQLAPPAHAALLRANTAIVWPGMVLPVMLAVIAFAGPLLIAPFAAAAMALSVVAGGWIAKFLIVTRASFNQGFALPRLPVRGAR